MVYASLSRTTKWFAIFIIGDQQHYVNEESSFWIDNIGRKQMIERLTQAGYFVYYSNLFEKTGEINNLLNIHIIYIN